MYIFDNIIKSSKTFTMRFQPFLITGLLIFFFACTNNQQENNAMQTGMNDANPDSATLVERGAYLVNAVGCDDCHSPKRMGPNGPEVIPETRFSGYPSTRPPMITDTSFTNKGMSIFAPDLTAFAGPWGISYAANISSDATGIGNWPEANFMRAIRKGKSKGLENARDLLPPMPWFQYRNFNDNDLRAIFAFLKASRPVENIVPASMIAEKK